jgi:hypothetical protein
MGEEVQYLSPMDTLDTDLREDEDGMTVRIPKSWVQDVRNVRLERHGSMIVMKTKPATLEDVARCCADWGGEFPDRLPQTFSGVRAGV